MICMHIQSKIESDVYRQDNKTDNLTSILAIMMITLFIQDTYTHTHCVIDTIKYSAVLAFFFVLHYSLLCILHTKENNIWSHQGRIIEKNYRNILHFHHISLQNKKIIEICLSYRVIGWISPNIKRK